MTATYIRDGQNKLVPHTVAIDNGNVVVTGLPAAVQGPGSPVVDSFHSGPVNLAASTTDQSLVSAPGEDKQIWVYLFWGTGDTAAGTLYLHDGDGTALTGYPAFADEGGFVIPASGNFAMPSIIVPTNKPLLADTGPNTFDGSMTWAIVSV